MVLLQRGLQIKKKNILEKGNYPPVSVLPAISKFVERAIFDQLTDFHFRDRTISVKGGAMVFCFILNFFSDNTRVIIFIFFVTQSLTLGYDKNSETDFFFSPPKSEYFYQNLLKELNF
jgi:hypothetical protein